MPAIGIATWAQDLALLRQRHPAAGGDKLVGRQRHIISVAPEHHQIMRVVGVAGGDGAAQLTPAFKQGDLRRRLMAAVAVLDPDQTEAGGQLDFPVTNLHFHFAPLGEARAADMAQAGDAVTNARTRRIKSSARRGAICKVSRGGVTPAAGAIGVSRLPARASSLPPT